MGIVAVRIYGSFGYTVDQVFSAEEGGHANAISRAMRELSDRLPHAIALDHKLQGKGIAPKSPWGEPER